jgi:hypothetical protein
MLGVSVSDIIGKSPAHFTHPEDIGNDEELFDELASGTRTSYEIDKALRQGGVTVSPGHTCVCRVFGGRMARSSRSS